MISEFPAATAINGSTWGHDMMGQVGTPVIAVESGYGRPSDGTSTAAGGSASAVLTKNAIITMRICGKTTLTINPKGRKHRPGR